MRCKSLIVLIGTVVIAGMAVAADYTMEALKSKLSASETVDAKLVIYQDFLKNGKDIDVLRVVQDDWRQTDSAGCASYFEKQVKKNPKSAKFTYLLGRIAKTDLEKIRAGRKAIELDPKFGYGYRLVLSNYMPLLTGNTRIPNLDSLKMEWVHDTAKYAAWAAVEPRNDASNKFLYDYLIYSKRYQEAEKILDRSKALKFSWADGQQFANLYILLERYENARLIVEEWVNENAGAKRWSDAEKQDRIDWMYIQALINGNADARIVKYLTQKKDYETRVEYLAMIAAAYVRLQDLDNAFKTLDIMATAGGAQMADLEGDEIQVMQKDPRWSATEAKLKDAYAKSADKRQAKVISQKIERPAPDWELATPSGTTVKLSSLRGQVVVLDFWATWCGPCRMAMPVISEYTAKKPANVRVFSIQVWEPDHQKAINFMNDKKYAMELLFGTEQTPKDYGVQGIPALFIIDKKGNIRYEEKGYSPELAEKLPWQVEDLLKD